MTRRDRTVLRTSIRRRHLAKLAVVLLGGCITLTACGPVQLGSAAIVGGQRITLSTLATEVSNLNQAYASEKHKVALGFSANQAPQEVLAWLIVFRVGDELGHDLGINLSPAQVQTSLDSLSSEIKQSTGSSLEAEAVAHGVPPNLISTQFASYEAIQTALTTKLSQGQTSTSAQQQVETELGRYQCLAAKNLNIKISPQFGRLNYTEFTIVPVANTLSAPGGTVKAASGSFTPPC
ncbi:MAG TPA: hypothetical protein VGH27_20930 [Streptosporangiaceae bacterium]|jgi:hypothetical protein